jgi:hypothetical protein
MGVLYVIPSFVAISRAKQEANIPSPPSLKAITLFFL